MSWRDVVIKRAKQFFGTTEDPTKAGYILPDGSMLDFSGDTIRGRLLDHTDIWQVMEPEDYPLDVMPFLKMYQSYNSISRFLTTGAIRVALVSGILMLDAMYPPTDAQTRRILDIMRGTGPYEVRRMTATTRTRTGGYDKVYVPDVPTIGGILKFWAEAFGSPIAS
ncbi:MAG: hypothetical protein ABIH46_07425 [Chloroflexota bacterium]